MAKYTLEIDITGDIIYGDDSILVLFNVNDILKGIKADFEWSKDTIEVSDEEIKGYDGILNLHRKNSENDDDDVYVNDNDYFCSEQFGDFFPLNTEKLYIKITKNGIKRQDKEPSERNSSLQD